MRTATNSSITTTLTRRASNMNKQLKERTAKVKDWLKNADPENPKHRAAIGRGLLVVWNNQTQDEKRDQTTKHWNDKGFAGNNARFGSSVAEQFRRKGDMSPKQAARVAKMLVRHARQIAADALRREAAAGENPAV